MFERLKRLNPFRESLAKEALADPSQSLWDIAVRLHYSDLSAFVRAFRRWTGSTPSVARAATAGTAGSAYK